MGDTDVATAKYMRRNEIFADAFNFFLYGGQKGIKPESLLEMDTKEITEAFDGEMYTDLVQRTRDVIKSLIAMTDRKTTYLILSVENQTNIHYAMPVRNMLYDALRYDKQVKEANAAHKQAGEYKNTSNAEYLSGFKKGDHLTPVITLVIHWGTDKWDGPLSLHEMFAIQNAEELSCVPDYKINLIEPAGLTDEEIEKFDSTLREVFTFIKHSDDPEQMAVMMENEDLFRNLDQDDIDVINAVTDAKLTIPEGEEDVNMCEAIRILNERAEEKGRIEVFKNMLSHGYSVEEAQEITGLSDEQVEEPVQMLDT